MKSQTEKLDQLIHDPEVWAWLTTESTLRGMFPRRWCVPPYWVALSVSPSGERHIFPAGEDVAPAAGGEVTLVRTTPLSLALSFEVPSHDGHQVAFTLNVQLEAVIELSELVSLRKNLLGSSTLVRKEDIRKRLHPALESDLRQFAGQNSIEDILRLSTDSPDAKLRDRLLSRLQEPLFLIGMKCLDLQIADIHSKTFEQTQKQQSDLRRQQNRQQMTEQIQSAIHQTQNSHLDHLTQMLERMKQMASNSSNVRLADIIAAFSSDERAELYQALLTSAVPTVSTQWIAAACGHQIVFLDPQNRFTVSHRLDLSPDIGPLRSIRFAEDPDHRRLLVGAAWGIHVVDADAMQSCGVYSARPEHPEAVRSGFNDAIIAGDRLLGTHSQLGLCCWRLNSEECVSLLSEHTRQAAVVRNVRYANNRIWLSVDHEVISFSPADSTQDQINPQKYTGIASPITALAITSTHVWAGTADGQIIQWDIEQPAAVRSIHHGIRRPVETLAIVDEGGWERFFFTDTSSAVHVQVIGDSFSQNYSASDQTIRRAAAAPDWIVGINEIRDRLLCWNTRDPRTPPAIIPLTQMIGHTIQDVCAIPNTV